MNEKWSNLNKMMQLNLKNANAFQEGIKDLLMLRKDLYLTLLELRNLLERSDFDALPFINVNGYHSKNIAYSIWHIFRIEDIVVHTLIKGDEQIFFKSNYQQKINSPIITTGNELIKHEIADFTKNLNIDELFLYIDEVKNSTDKMLNELTYKEIKNKISAERKDYLKSLQVVSQSENAIWLIDYWCSKDVRGLIQMPLSRHWIMHIEAINRIQAKIV